MAVCGILLKFRSCQPKAAQGIRGLSVSYQWVIRGLSEGYQWVTRGLSVGYQWVIRGYQWVIRGLSEGYQWVIRGLSVGYQWVNDLIGSMAGMYKIQNSHGWTINHSLSSQNESK